MNTKSKAKKSTGKMLIDALNEAVAFHEGKVTLRTESVAIPNDPPELSSREIKKIREQLNLSQPIFAKYLGVSDKAVKGWEQGGGHPNGAALRLLELAKSDPKTFQTMILKASFAS